MPQFPPLNLSEINHFVSPAEPNLLSPECLKVFSVFRQNIESAIGLSLVPGISALLSVHMMEAMGTAQERVEMVPDMFKTDEEKREHIWQLGCEFLKEIAARENSNWHSGVTNYTDNLDDASPIFTTQSYQIFEGLLKVIVVQFWSALETLSRDLWKSICDSQNRSFVRPSDKDRKRNNLWFTSRSGIRKCYAFSFKCPKIDSAIHEDRIDALALLRNVIVHSAGKVDKEFKNECGNFAQLSMFTSLTPDDRIPFDGLLVKSVIEPAVAAAYILTSAVDDWLTKNP